MRKCSIATIFWLLVGVFIVVLAEFFLPALRDLLKGSTLFLIPIIIFSLVGLVLLIVTLKTKLTGKLRRFLILTGASSIGFFVAVFLHNAFYALNAVTGDIIALNYLTQALHIFFFFIAIIACPVGFLIGMIGSIVLLVKQRK